MDTLYSKATIHSNIENPVTGIPIIDLPINYGKSQIVISEVEYDPPKPKILKLFNAKQRISVQFSKNNYEQEMINLIKEYVGPKVKYHHYFDDPLYKKLSVVLQTYFKNSEINLVKCTKKLLDIVYDDEITNIIRNYHESKTNHRGIEETSHRIKQTYYWPKQKDSIQTYQPP